MKMISDHEISSREGSQAYEDHKSARLTRNQSGNYVTAKQSTLPSAEKIFAKDTKHMHADTAKGTRIVSAMNLASKPNEN